MQEPEESCKEICRTCRLKRLPFSDTTPNAKLAGYTAFNAAYSLGDRLLSAL